MPFPVMTLANFEDILDNLDDDFNLPLIIALSSGLGVLFVVLLILTIYFSFFSQGGVIFLGSTFNIPGEFDDVERMRNEEEDALPKMSPEEREAYITAKQFQEDFPPNAKSLGSTISEADQTHITDRGIQAYYFEHALEQDPSSPEIIIEDKLDVHFSSTSSNSAILNFPLPVKDNDTVYFEVKLFELAHDSLVSVGLATKPYPLFRLPGHNRYSIAYESDGTVRVNQPFYSPSIWDELIEGDVIGCGFKPRSGTIFFTHNGKKVLEAAHNVKFDMYPIVGAKGVAKLSVNLGQLGYVFIEANVKKWGFGPVFGTIGVPPAYGKEISNDKVLDKGDELPPHYPSEEETFFGPSALLNSAEASSSAPGPQPTSASASASKPTQTINKPPSYTDEPKQELHHGTPIPGEGDEVAERLYERRSSTFDLVNNQYEPLEGTKSMAAPQASQDGVEESTETDPDATIGVTDTEVTPEPVSHESTPEQESHESTPEPSATSSSLNKSKPKNKKKKKNNKKKGKGRNW